MKRTMCVLLLSASLLLMSGCSSADSAGSAAEAVENAASEIQEKVQEETFVQNTSSDKHLSYVKKYIGMNAAAVGYDSLGGERRDEVGETNVRIIFVTEDGTYIGQTDEEAEGISSKDLLKDYVVTAQDPVPNTEVHIEFQKDSEGNEYSLTDWKSIDEIVLAVKKAGSLGNGPSLTPIAPSPDKHTYYSRDYVGKNLHSIGYESLGGVYLDEYGDGHIQLDIITDDGSYADYADPTVLQQYVVTSQSVAPGTELDLVYNTYSDGTESGLVDSQNIDSITLNVKKISG